MRRPLWTSSQCSLLMANSWMASLRAWNNPYTSTDEKCAAQSAWNSSGRYSLTCQGLPDFSAPSGASVSTLGVDTYTAGAPLSAVSALKRSRISSGFWTCSIVCRKTTASAGSAKVSTRSRAKRTLGEE